MSVTHWRLIVDAKGRAIIYELRGKFPFERWTYCEVAENETAAESRIRAGLPNIDGNPTIDSGAAYTLEVV